MFSFRLPLCLSALSAFTATVLGRAPQRIRLTNATDVPEDQRALFYAIGQEITDMSKPEKVAEFRKTQSSMEFFYLGDGTYRATAWEDLPVLPDWHFSVFLKDSNTGVWSTPSCWIKGDITDPNIGIFTFHFDPRKPDWLTPWSTATQPGMEKVEIICRGPEYARTPQTPPFPEVIYW